MTRPPDHPIWSLAHIVIICLTLLGLQLISSTSWDAELFGTGNGNGELQTLAGVGSMAILIEWIRQRKK
jgi:hypothetical protein